MILLRTLLEFAMGYMCRDIYCLVLVYDSSERHRFLLLSIKVIFVSNDFPRLHVQVFDSLSNNT